MTKKFRIVSVGMEDRNSQVLKQLLTIYANHLDGDWEYLGNFAAEQVIATMGSQLDDAHVKLIDTDSELGKRAWYFLQAMDNDNSLIELSDTKQSANYRAVTKPLTLNIESLVGLLRQY